MRGALAPERRVAPAFLGLFTVLGRLTLGSGPIGPLGLRRLTRGTDPGPMVPTIRISFSCKEKNKKKIIKKLLLALLISFGDLKAYLGVEEGC